MPDKNLKKDLEKVKNKMKFPAWGLLIGFVSVLYGQFIVSVQGYLLSQVEPYFYGVNEGLVGWALIILGAFKLIGLLFDNKMMARLSIIGLTIMWSGLFILAITYSFGTGFPHPSYISNGTMAIACLIVSWRGNYNK